MQAINLVLLFYTLVVFKSNRFEDSQSDAELSNDTLLNIRKMQSSFPTLVGYSLHFAWKTISSLYPLLPPHSFILSLFSFFLFFHKNEFLCGTPVHKYRILSMSFNSWIRRSILEIRKSLSLPFLRWNFLFSGVRVSSIRKT